MSCVRCKDQFLMGMEITTTSIFRWKLVLVISIAVGVKEICLVLGFNL